MARTIGAEAQDQTDIMQDLTTCVHSMCACVLACAGVRCRCVELCLEVGGLPANALDDCGASRVRFLLAVNIGVVCVRASEIEPTLVAG